MKQLLHLVPNDYQISKKLFEKEKSKIVKFLSEFDIKIEHIGSTAIPKTIGKGIIDILIICESEEAQLKARKELIKNGYRQGELQKKPDGRLFFYLSTSKDFRGGIKAEDVHLHLIVNGDKKNLVSISMRDHLRTHQEDLEDYNKEKLRLKKLTNSNRHDYAVKKEDFIKKLLNKIG